jgi:hypothetical protein
MTGRDPNAPAPPRSAGRTHIVGAGLAGLSAALRIVEAGGRATVYEGAPQAGGRARTLQPADGFAHDNGTHVLFTANYPVMRFLDAVGARSDWIEPEPGAVPVFDVRTGRLNRVGLSPWSWLRRGSRPDGLDLKGVLRLLRLSLPLPDRPIGAVMGDSPLVDTLVEPLTVAILNTPVATASSRRLGLALRRLARPGAGRLLVARRGLSPDLVEPARRRLEASGVPVETGRRLRAVEQAGGRATALVFADRTVALGPDDRAILALPPWEVARLLPGSPVPDTFEPILNLHYRMEGPASPRFVGLIGSLSQWALVRDDHTSVTVSAAGEAVDLDQATLAARVWGEIAPALRALGLAVPEAMPEFRVVKEKRATIRQDAGPLPQPLVRPLANLTLAGDWIGDLPATIESAVVAGERAVQAFAGPAPRPASGPLPSPLPAGGKS